MIARACSERRDRAFGIAFVQVDHPQVGERRGFFVASARLPRGGQDRFGMPAGRLGVGDWLRHRCPVAPAAAIRARPRGKGSVPASGSGLASGHRDLIRASSRDRPLLFGPDQDQVVLSVAALFRGGAVGKLEIALFAASRSGDSRAGPRVPLAPCRARIELAAGRAQALINRDLPAGDVGDAFPVLKARVSVGRAARGRSAPVRARFPKHSFFESEISPVGCGSSASPCYDRAMIRIADESTLDLIVSAVACNARAISADDRRIESAGRTAADHEGE